MTLKKILPLMILFGFAFSTAGAQMEVKGAGNGMEKSLVLSWAHHYLNARLTYDSKDSSDAIHQFLGKGCDYALIDAPLTPLQLQKNHHTLLFIPIFLSAQVVVYNLPGIPTGALRLTSRVLSDIFMGKIQKWNDPALKKLNPRLELPDLGILVVHQSSESSKNDFFPSFLMEQNPLWVSAKDNNKDLHWRIGQNVNGGMNVIRKMRQWAGVLAVVNFSFAMEKHLPVAQIQNKSGRFVKPSQKTLAEALSHEKALPLNDWVKISETHSHQAYPLTSVEMVMADQNYNQIHHNSKKGQALVDFLNWILSPAGQAVVAQESFVPFPQKFLPQIRSQISLIQY